MRALIAGLGLALAAPAPALAGGDPPLAQGAVGLLLLLPEGDPLPGSDVSLVVAVHEGGRPVPTATAPTVEPSRGTIAGPAEELRPGVWRYRYGTPASTGPVRVVIALPGAEGAPPAHADATFQVTPSPESTVSLPSMVDGLAGQPDPILIHVTGPDLPAPGELEVAVDEGRVVGVRSEGTGLVVAWLPGEDRFPRVVAIGVRDGRHPRRPPAWTVARIRARADVPVRTEPGTKVEVRIGGRTYGPFAAGSDGVAQASADVRPGEDTAQLVLTDALGNTQRSELRMGGDPRPALGVLAEGGMLAGRDPPPVHVFAVDARGAPWKGAAPSCGTSSGADAVPVEVGRGRWWLVVPPPPPDAFFDLRVDCTLDRTRASVRIPVEPGLPARLVLRAYPEQLSADLPVAQVQAWLENHLGDRLPPGGIRLGADLGEVVRDLGAPSAMVGASYHGARAAEAGRDTLRAEWDLPTGTGAPWQLVVGTGAAPDGSLGVVVRALDRAGRPLGAVPVDVDAGGTSRSTVTGPRGWGEVRFPIPEGAEPLVVEARAAGLVRREVAFPRAPEPLPVTGGPDFADVHDLLIRAGRVREVSISINPRSLASGSGETAVVRVQLLDKAKQTVTDEDLVLSATSGVVTKARREGNGTFVATYAPPLDLHYGTVQITATTADGGYGASTDVEIAPREIRRAPSLNVGWLVGPGSVSSPWADLEVDVRLQRLGRPVYGRLSIGAFGSRATADDGLGGTVPLSMDVLPVGVGGLVRTEQGRRALWLGTELVVAPYHLVARFDGSAVDAVSVAPPGFSLFTGAGLRFRNSEVQLQARYLFVSMIATDIGWQGQIGGFVGSLGYKLLY